MYSNNDVYNGESFNELYGNYNEYIIFVDESNMTYDYKYCGIGTKSYYMNYNAGHTHQYLYGGIEIININDLYKCIIRETFEYYFDVNIPNDSIISIGFDDKIKIDKIEILKNKKSIKDLFLMKKINKETIINIIKNNKWMSKYLSDINISDQDIKYMLSKNINLFKTIKPVNKEIIIDTMNIDGLLLEFVDYEYQDLEICNIAVNNNILAFKFTKYQSHDMCIKVLKQNPFLLEYVIKQNEQLCKFALLGNIKSYIYIKNKSNSLNEYAINLDPFALEFIENQTEDIIFSALRNNAKSFKYAKIQTKKMCDELFNINKKFIEYFNEQLPYYCLCAVNEDANNLKLIRREYQTLDICWIAIKKNPYMLEYAYVQDKEMCEFVIKYDNKLMKFARKYNNANINISQNNLNSLKDEELYKILTNNPALIKQIQNPSNNLIRFVVNINGCYLRYIDKNYQDDDIIILAFKRYPAALKFAAYQNKRICDEFILNYSNNQINFDKYWKNLDFEYVSDDNINKFVYYDPDNIKYIPKNKQTEELCIYCLTNSYDTTQKYIQIESNNINIIHLQNDGLYLNYINNKTYELCKIAVENNCNAIDYVPDEFKTEELYNILLNTDYVHLVLDKIPKKYITYDLYKKIVKRSITILKNIPTEFKTPELLNIALNTSAYAIEYIDNPSLNMYMKAISKAPYILYGIKDKDKFPIDLKILTILNNTYIANYYNDIDDITTSLAKITNNEYNLVLNEKYDADMISMCFMLNPNIENYLNNDQLNKLIDCEFIRTMRFFIL